MNLKLAIAFAGGVVVGALVMWRGAGSHFREVADAEIEEMRVFYQSREDEALEEAKRAVENAVHEAAEEEWRSRPENEVVEGPSGPSYKDDPDVLATTSEAAQALLEYQGNDAATESHIVLLTQREYEDETPDDYDQVTLTYWALDGILTTPDDKQLEVKKAVGDLDPAWFGEKGDYPDVCYVRNTRMKIDFEVVRSLESYGKTVLGLGDGSG